MRRGSAGAQPVGASPRASAGTVRAAVSRARRARLEQACLRSCLCAQPCRMWSLPGRWRPKLAPSEWLLSRVCGSLYIFSAS